MPRLANDLHDYLSDLETTLPKPRDLGDMAHRIAALHRENSGTTFNLYFGDMADQKLYAVALYPEQSATLPGRNISVGDLQDYIQLALPFLQDARNNIGTWYNQIAIYDLAGQREIAIGGSGTPTDGLPPAGERLPKLTRGMWRERNG